MEFLLDLKLKRVWNWDYVINLSESDFPTKTLKEFTRFLHGHCGNNFLGINPDIKLSMLRCGGHKHFVECDDRMWLIGDRGWPRGIQYGGSGDWFLLHVDFVEYMLTSRDEYLLYLKESFKYTLMGPEVK